MRAVSLAAFSRIMAGSIAKEAIAEVGARGAMAAAIAERARARIGDAEALPPPLAESTQTERVRKGFSADETLLRTGALRDSITWSHETPSTTLVGSTDAIAPYQELGTPKIPARPFFGSTLSEDTAELGDVLFSAFAAAFRI